MMFNLALSDDEFISKPFDLMNVLKIVVGYHLMSQSVAHKANGIGLCGSFY